MQFRMASLGLHYNESEVKNTTHFSHFTVSYRKEVENSLGPRKLGFPVFGICCPYGSVITTMRQCDGAMSHRLSDWLSKIFTDLAI